MTGIDRSLIFGITSLALYVLGGVSTFAGIGMVMAFKGTSLMGLGDAGSLGYVFICVGLCVSVAGVLMMRILRNRRLA